MTEKMDEDKMAPEKEGMGGKGKGEGDGEGKGRGQARGVDDEEGAEERYGEEDGGEEG